MVRQKTGDETAQAGSTDHAEHPSVMGLVFNLRPGEVETYVSDFPRFLRVRPNENYDLLLDESILIDPSRGDYTKVTYLHGKGERIANVTRQVGS